MSTKKQSPIHGFAILGIIAILAVVPRILEPGLSNAKTTWSGVVLLLVILVFVAGHWVTGVWRGALINDRNRMSLSQIQLVIWTVLVLATFLTGAFANLGIGDSDPLKIIVPPSLWMLMGISTTSLIGSPLLASRKKSVKASAEEEARAMNKLADQGRNASRLDTEGRLLANTYLQDARWSDIFEADEVSRAGRLDMSKVQMLFFTLIVAIVYGTMLASTINTLGTGGFHEFPAIDDSMVALLGISHAGFLTARAVPERESIQ